MKRNPTRFFAPLLSALLMALSALALALPASAHDDGLTCHSHGPVIKDRLWVFSGGLASIEYVEHSVENRLAADGSGFTAADQAAARRGLAELQEMTEIVYLLVVRAERLDDPGSAAAAMELARAVFDELPLANHAEFESFQSENRVANRVVVPLEAVSSLLASEFGVSAELIDVVERAAASC